MIEILAITKRQVKNGAKWVTIESEEKTVNRAYYDNFVKGGFGKIRQHKNYTPLGYNVVRDFNTSPDGKKRVVTEFKIEYK